MYIITRQTLEQQAPPKCYHKFGMEFMNLPVGLGISSEKLCLSIYTADKPSVENEKTTVEQRGFQAHFSGKDTFSGTWSVQFYDTVDEVTTQALILWKERACNLKTGASVHPTLYKARCVATDLSFDNSELTPYDIKGIFPQSISYGDGWGTSVSPQILAVTFSYDYWEWAS